MIDDDNPIHSVPGAGERLINISNNSTHKVSFNETGSNDTLRIKTASGYVMEININAIKCIHLLNGQIIEINQINNAG